MNINRVINKYQKISNIPINRLKKKINYNFGCGRK